jgi:transaldolase
MTTVVADTGNIDAIRKFQPQDATTNPTLLLQAASLPQYQPLVTEAITWGLRRGQDESDKLTLATDKLAVLIGREIISLIPGRISTEVDARLSFNTNATIARAHRLMELYQREGIDTDRVLIKIAATWEGIRAAEQLEKAGIQTNLTLLFNFAQAAACADAGVYLISPFVGRILDWHRKHNGLDHCLPHEDPGVQSVSRIYNYYRRHGYETVVMGASFRNTGQITELAGCDRLTISPALLEELSQSDDVIDQKLHAISHGNSEPHCSLDETGFRWFMNDDAMATDKLAEGIRQFARDQESLESLLGSMNNP